MPQTPQPIQISKFRRELAAWFAENARTLPWRNAPTLYKTVVSEFMLQQTQVDTVLPYFARWMDRFPDFAALAAAKEAEVVKHWEGLGYYTRARNLHKLARELAAMDGDLPKTAAAWQQLPGIGPYTSAAISSIALGAREAVVDGNVIRILTRLGADSTEFKDNAAALKALRPRAQELLNPDSPGAHNEAMMELGATVCKRRKPPCLLCPVRAHCAAGRDGTAEAYPVLKRKAQVQRTINRIWMVRDGQLLLQRRPANARRLPGICELPESDGLAMALPEGALLAVRKRGIANENIEERIFKMRATPARLEKVSASPGLLWHPLDRLDALTLSGPHKKWIRELSISP